MRYHLFETDRRLCLDLDTGQDDAWVKRLIYLQDCGLVAPGGHAWREFDSNTPGHKHIIVKLSKPTPPERRAWLSMFLFSDPWRAVAGVLRHHLKEKYVAYVVRSIPYPGIKADLVCECPIEICKNCNGDKSRHEYNGFCNKYADGSMATEKWVPEKLKTCQHVWACQRFTSYNALAKAFKEK